MANSPSHQLGELIGDFFEETIISFLQPRITRRGYYLDYKHARPARGNKREVIGVDQNGNRHKLDIVIESGGSEYFFGTPKAFIEIAWRRYVKHSKNKVQEISGAIMPLVERYADSVPFYAAVLSGEFTENSIRQLESQGFFVLYICYEDMCRLFDTIGMSIRWEEDTSNENIQLIVDDFLALDETRKKRLERKFYNMFHDQLVHLYETLVSAIETVISEVIVIPLHGTIQVLESVEDAMRYVMDYDETAQAVLPILRYEIIVRYNSGEEYTMRCNTKSKALQFLRQYT